MYAEVVSILDRFVKLLERRERYRRDFFRDQLEPLFLELATVHEDYRGAFQDVASLLRDADVPPHEVHVEVEKRRDGMEHIRAKLQGLEAALTDHLASKASRYPDEALAFVRAVVAYFQLGAGERSTLQPAPGSTYFTTLHDVIYMFHTGSFERRECLRNVEALTDLIDTSWAAVTAAYGRARVACLSR